ncbi:NUDIX hydrolase [Alteribacter aurantiacus]|uniref:NUDIX hydrolase n=1 Tax=Alteribacter aurantiacus TaxID=254410 RepID=UPI00041660E8|nr:NUDIX hydrolase [Alteribacter aurantiacus]
MSYFSEMRKYVGNRPLILPGSVVIILNEEKEVLLQQRPDMSWGLPGGLMELGESLEETAARETLEETGLRVSELKLVHVFSGEKYYLKVANGDEFYSVTAVYVAGKAKGSLKVDGIETKSLSYFPLNDLPKGLGRSYKEFLDTYKKLNGAAEELRA